MSYYSENIFILDKHSDPFPSKMFNDSKKALNNEYFCCNCLKVVPVIGCMVISILMSILEL